MLSGQAPDQIAHGADQVQGTATAVTRPRTFLQVRWLSAVRWRSIAANIYRGGRAAGDDLVSA
ncbi:hypothetical protein, partial [Xanthomonas citri]|uniref:hypothetical protein n=1 Tax=Xanthomonas citri TaxID=346 RepID=UPI001FF05508